MAEPSPNAVPRNDSEKAKMDSDAAERLDSSAKSDLETLSAEQQMAQFEEELKNTDWGHQPC